jgi:Natural resistance-associated macrophage protein
MQVFLSFSRDPTRRGSLSRAAVRRGQWPRLYVRALPSVPCAQQHRGNWLGRLGLAVSRRPSGRESVRSAILPRLSFKSHIVVVVNQTKKILRLRWAALRGPGLLVMLADCDAGNVVTAAQGGAHWGSHLWLVLRGLIPLLYMVQELTARLAIFTGRGHGERIRTNFGPVWAWISTPTPSSMRRLTSGAT